MSEIEIWVREDPEETEQTPYVNGDGGAYLIPSEDASTVYTFDKVGLSKCMQLIFCKPLNKAALQSEYFMLHI